MFRSPVVADPPTHVEESTSELIPLSILQLDLPAPVEGWNSYLNSRSIPVVEDDLGRAAVARSVARMLLAEQREQEARSRELAAERERQAIEADRLRRAQIHPGIPAYLIPDGVSPGLAMAQAERLSQKSVRTTLLEHELSGAGDTMVFHSFVPDEE
jgi:hypothetical protein